METKKEILGLSKKELKIKLGVSYYTLACWLEPHLAEIGEYRGGKYTPGQLKIIYTKLDLDY